MKNQFDVGYVGSSSTGVHVDNKEGGNGTWEDNISRFQGTTVYAIGHEFGMYSELSEEVPNPSDERFYRLLKAVNRPFMERMYAFSIVSGGKNIE